ncbi:MAG TPA: DUF378 domain-containing protein [Methanotrichaceae archaeon]|nr:DUF378 domain-containing protein [Methanotrichaceae archaeon]
MCNNLNYWTKLHYLSKFLVIIGALNWGLVGLISFNLVSALFGKKSAASRLIYTLVGLAAIYLVATAKKEAFEKVMR